MQIHDFAGLSHRYSGLFYLGHHEQLLTEPITGVYPVPRPGFLTLSGAVAVTDGAASLAEIRFYLVCM